MDLLPGASLEFRVYVLLGAIGVMFFAAILALGVGRLTAMRNSSDLNGLSSNSTPFGASEKAEKTKKTRPEKLAKVKKEKRGSVTAILESEEESFEEVEFEPKTKRFGFGKKKKDAVEMLSAPSGYNAEYAPVHTRNVDSKNLPELVDYDASSEYNSKPANLSKQPKDSELDNWESPAISDALPAEDKDQKKRGKNSNSPFGGADDWEF